MSNTFFQGVEILFRPFVTGWVQEVQAQPHKIWFFKKLGKKGLDSNYLTKL